MTLYHVTTREKADKIEREGFIDCSIERIGGELEARRGVWISDKPLWELYPLGFEIDLSPESIAAYECPCPAIEGARCWLVPASVLNQTDRRGPFTKPP